jgi:hypothetical protein
LPFKNKLSTLVGVGLESSDVEPNSLDGLLRTVPKILENGLFAFILSRNDEYIYAVYLYLHVCRNLYDRSFKSLGVLKISPPILSLKARSVVSQNIRWFKVPFNSLSRFARRSSVR